MLDVTEISPGFKELIAYLDNTKFEYSANIAYAELPNTKKIGHFYSFKNGAFNLLRLKALTHSAARAELTKKWKHHVILDRYKHTGTTWSIEGEGIQCRFDTVTFAGVWRPSRSHLYKLSKAVDVDKLLRAQCREALSTYNAWLNGELYDIYLNIHDVNSFQGTINIYDSSEATFIAKIKEAVSSFLSGNDFKLTPLQEK